MRRRRRTRGGPRPVRGGRRRAWCKQDSGAELVVIVIQRIRSVGVGALPGERQKQKQPQILRLRRPRKTRPTSLRMTFDYCCSGSDPIFVAHDDAFIVMRTSVAA